ncbi:methyl-accepting chemotaxis protein [Methylibium rhizosphaerae]|uniref:methyl-accepting chemotaxis protein n=1 Tax=Methylibium rhizosphaerae TaxID=2570323 RepID=UPI0011276CB6|nr:methyl-accepting chemotaxis protein [Methylibium rhizosphaerae]
MFKNLAFKQKILLLVGVAIAGLLTLSAVAVVQVRNHIGDGRQDQLVMAVQSAHSIVAAYQAKAASGAMSVEDAQKAAKDALRLSRYGGADGKADYFYIWNTDGAGVMHPIKPEWDGQVMVGKVKDAGGMDIIRAIVDGVAKSKDGKAFVPTNFPRPGKTEPVPKLQYVMLVPGWNWIVGSGLYMDDLDVAMREALLSIVGIAVGLLLVISGIGYVVARGVLRQIGGEPSEAMVVMSEVARGNLAVDLHNPQPGSLLAALSDMLGSLRGTVAQVRQSTDSITTASTEIATGNQDLSSRTEQTASNLQQTASSMEQLTGTVKQTADSARTANQLASSASASAARGGEVVAQVVATMDEINASSKKIADIIGVIDGIAFQTNILALNAAVEAARAGEQGRGFAVVAGEVRSLAQRSAQAAKEIKSLIGASVERVETGSKLVQDAGSTMAEIVADVARVSDIIGEITAAASEQSDGIGQVNTAVTQLDQMTQQNAALVEESAAAAASLREQAQKLAAAVAVFRLGQAELQAQQQAGLAIARAQQSSSTGLAKPAAPAPKAAAPKAAAPLPRIAPVTAPAPLPPAASAKDDTDWETF